MNALSLGEILQGIEALPREQQRRVKQFSSNLDVPGRMNRAEFEALVRAFQASPPDSDDARALWSLIERELQPPVSPIAPPTLSKVLDHA